MDSLTGIINYKECGKDGVWYPFLPHCFLCIVGLVFPLPLMFSCLLCVWQESCDYSEQRKESADLEYELDAREVGEQPKNAEPRPPRPNISPKKIPAMRPTLSGMRSVA